MTSGDSQTEVAQQTITDLLSNLSAHPKGYLRANEVKNFIRNLLSLMNTTEISKARWSQDIASLQGEYVKDLRSDGWFDRKLLDEFLPSRNWRNKGNKRQIPYNKDLTFYFKEITSQLVEVIFQTNGYPYVRLQVVPSLERTVRSTRTGYTDWATATIITDLTNVVWSPAHGITLSKALPFKDFVKDVFNDTSFENIWFNHIPEQGYFVLNNDVTLLDETLNSSQVHNFFNQGSFAAKERISAHASLSKEYFETFVAGASLRERQEDFWQHVFRSPHLTSDIIVEACETVSGRRSLDVMCYSLSEDQQHVLFEALDKITNSAKPEFLYDEALNIIKKNRSLPGSIWGFLRADASTTSVAEDLKMRTVPKMLETLRWVHSQPSRPEWTTLLVEKIAENPQGVKILANMLASNGLIEPELIDTLPDEWILKYSVSVL